MAIITLTSDMGMQNFYLAGVKGKILTLNPNINIVDIAHNIPHFNAAYAAFIIKNCFNDFPKGTVHLISIDDTNKEHKRHILAVYKNQYFLAPDNGLFSMLFDAEPDAYYEVNVPMDSDVLTFPLKHLYIKIAVHLAEGGSPEVIGKKCEDIYESTTLQPTIKENQILGRVVYVDNYDNLITNISNTLFKRVGKNRAFKIELTSSKDIIRSISKNYYDSKEADIVCLFGEKGFLEIAINRGAPKHGQGAGSLLNLKLDAAISIDFSNERS